MNAAQPFIRRGTRSNATARRLIASSSTIAPHVLNETIEDDQVVQTVQPCRSQEAGMLAGVPVFPGQRFYLVRSKFIGRCYVLTRCKGQWLCSSRDMKELCIKRVETYRAGAKARRVA